MPTDPEQIRTLARLAAVELYRELRGNGHALPPEPVEVQLADREVEVRIVVVRRGQQEQAAVGSRNGYPDSRTAGARHHLTALDRDILGAATDVPQTMGELARSLEHDTDSYFRGRVRRLKRLGLLSVTGDGRYLRQD